MDLFDILSNMPNYKGINRKKELVDSLHESTNFLPSSASTLQRIWHVLNKQSNPPCCHTCDNPVTWSKWKYKYPSHCSTKCSNTDPTVIAHKQSRVQELYGKSNVMQVIEIKDKQRAVVMDKFGVSNISQHTQTMSNKKANYMELHGVDNPRKNPKIKEKIKQTMLDKYGVDNPMKSDVVRHKSITTNNTKFNRDNISQMHLTPEQLELMNSIDWLTEQHHTNERTITDIANEIGIFCSTLCYKFDEFGIQKRRYAITQPHKDIIELLQSVGIQNIIVNDRTILDPKELDIFLPDYNIAIEYCGLYWHSDIHDRITASTHASKYHECDDKGIRLITVFEDEWLNTNDLVRKKILHLVGKSVDCSIHGRKTVLNINEKINVDAIVKFMTDNHIQGPPSVIGIHSVVTLSYNDDVVAMCILRKQQGIFDIVRYATTCNVRGGFGKVLSGINDKFDNPPIITFADLRWSNGNLYYRLGFELISHIKPDYQYVIGTKREHKFNFRRKHLPNKLSIFDPDLSESENMRMNNIHKIYNCGLLKFGMNFNK